MLLIKIDGRLVNAAVSETWQRLEGYQIDTNRSSRIAI